MNVYKSIVYVLSVLLSGHIVLGQINPKHQLDSMQQVLDTMDKTDGNKVAQLGELILANSTSDAQRYQVLGVIINTYAVQNEKQKSIHYLFKAQDIAERMDNPEMMVRVYGTIASLYASLALNEKAHEYIQKSRKQIGRLPDGIDKYYLNAFIYSETGTMYYNHKDYRNANSNYKKSLKAYTDILGLDSTIQSSFYYKNAVYNVGKTFLYIQQPDSAIWYMNKALTIASRDQFNLNYYIKTSLSEVYTAQNNHQRSIDTLQGIINDPTFDIQELKSDIYLDLAQNYKALGDSTSYALYNEKYVNITPQIQGEDLNAINSVFVAEENRYKKSITSSKKEKQVLLLVVIGILVVSAVSIYFIYKKNRKDTRIYRDLMDGLKSKRATMASPNTATLEENNISQINSSVEEDILKKLQRFETTEQFTNPRLTLASLAVKLKTNNTYLSEIINREKGKNFNAYINQLRIDYICEKIHSDPKYLEYKISYLAEASGFNSHSAFTTLFKNLTGISPSVFLKKARTQRQNETP